MIGVASQRMPFLRSTGAFRAILKAPCWFALAPLDALQEAPEAVGRTEVDGGRWGQVGCLLHWSGSWREIVIQVYGQDPLTY